MFWWMLILSVSCLKPVASSQVDIQSSLVDFKDSQVHRQDRQINRIITVTRTVTTTVSTSGFCAKLVNVTGACFRQRNQWIEEPIVLTFDENTDELDRLFSPSSFDPLEITAQPTLVLFDQLETRSVMEINSDSIQDSFGRLDNFAPQIEVHHKSLDDKLKRSFQNQEVLPHLLDAARNLTMDDLLVVVDQFIGGTSESEETLMANFPEIRNLLTHLRNLSRNSSTSDQSQDPKRVNALSKQTNRSKEIKLHRNLKSYLSQVTRDVTIDDITSSVNSLEESLRKGEYKSPHHRETTPFDQSDIGFELMKIVEKLLKKQRPPIKSHRQPRQLGIGAALLLIQVLTFAITSSGFSGTLSPSFGIANALVQQQRKQEQEREEELRRQNFLAAQSIFNALATIYVTETTVATIYSTTSTGTIFIQNCTPNPLPVPLCARRRQLL